LNAVAPDRLLREALSFDGQALRCGDQTYDLDVYARVVVIGAGKASAPMARALEQMLADRIDVGFVVVREGYTVPTERIEIFEAAHPVPDERSRDGAARVLELAREAGPDDLVICLLSGGGSSLLLAPADGLGLDDLQKTTDVLVGSGADITAINTIRKHCSKLKGGRLAETIAPATSLTLVLSDVVGNPLDAIASGPTVPDASTFEHAWQVVERFELEDELPEGVVAHIRAGVAGERYETPKQGSQAFEKTTVTVIGDCATAAEAALEQAREEGLDAAILTTTLEGEAREVGVVCASLAREVRDHHRPIEPPACLILAGETTVTLRGDGTGGRNQELALSAARALAGEADILVATLATDGTDGPTDAAGAIIDGETVERGQQTGLDAVDHLRRNDAYPFLEATGELLLTGPTNTNVNDLVCLFVTAPAPSDPTP
jgi:hydroxypyruvate reductase